MGDFSFVHVSLVFGGIALFLYGVRQASAGLKGLAGGRLKIVLGIIAGRRLRAMAAGVAVTFMLQSTVAAAIMLVGLCNVGLLNLHQAAGIVLGSYGLFAALIITGLVWFTSARRLGRLR